ncbi:SGNH/GDSL hydrolase family protein [Sciscionella sediminilitoris]|uniref:SGNH/GDSL hydrolase family protein n=1 Tax=Sciscionella sediminilitoris TaxID=1445613 RepID=UPI0018D0DBD3|nr:GDSL-type esterase/lipase family protein [Sciscionella sp. SE31]
MHERIRWELDRLRDIVINSGVSGWRVSDVSASFEHLIGRFAPGVVSISLGTNDALAGADGLADFRRRLTDLVRRSADLGALVVLHTPVLTTSDAPVNRRTSLAAYAEQVRAVAGEQSSFLVDHEAYWREHFEGAAPIPWMDDHSHPNAVGHREMANTALRALGLGELTERP